MDKAKKGVLITSVLVLVACGLFYFKAVEEPDWGSKASEKKIVENVWHRKPWTNVPIDLKPGGTAVMMKLLELDRGEIQYWEEKLFTLSFWVNSAILAIVSFALKRTPPTTILRWVCAAGCVFLCVFYLIFVSFAEKAMVTNDHDVRGIQYALHLSTMGSYLKGQTIYECLPPNTLPPCKDYDLIGHDHIKHLVQFNVFLVIFSVVLFLVLLPLDQAQPGRSGEETE